jgi:hypothetical protein
VGRNGTGTSDETGLDLDGIDSHIDRPRISPLMYRALNTVGG